MNTDIIAGILGKVLKKRSVDVPTAKADKVADQIAKEINTKNSGVAVVPVQSAWKSKINWLNGGVIAGVLGWFGVNVPTTPEEWSSAIVGVVVPALTIIIKTWFTNTVAPASLVSTVPIEEKR